jgi:hypothetical protein
MQSLTAFDNGWNDAVISAQKLPPLEEFQALDHIATRQLAYLFQEGIPEYSASCEYHQNSIVKKAGTYELYGSLINTNTGNALPAAVDDTNWKYLGVLGASGLPAASNAQSNAGSSSTVALVPSNFAQQSKSTNGYQKLPSGLILQWGDTGGLSVTFPITFPTSCLQVLLTDTISPANANAVTSKSTTGFTFVGDGTACFFAIGY